LVDDASFCEKCGEKIDTDYVRIESAMPAVQTEQNHENETSIDSLEEKARTENIGKNDTLPKVISVIVLVALLFIRFISGEAALKGPLSPSEFFELCGTGTPKQVEEAIKNGADIKSVDEEGNTPLMYAASNNHNPEIITALIKNGASVDDRDEDSWTPLMFAARYNTNPEIISTLVKNGASVDDKNEGSWTPLMLAACDNTNPEIISILIKNGASVDDKSIGGFTPLVFASGGNSNPEIISILIRNGASVDDRYEDGATPLMFAARGNTNPEIIMVLIENGADINARDDSGKSAFDYARENENPDILKKLQELSNSDATQTNIRTSTPPNTHPDSDNAARTTASQITYDYQGSAGDFVNEFIKNSFAAEEKYVGKRIKITGTVDSIERGPDGNPIVSIKIYKPIDLFGGAEQLYNPIDSGDRIICLFGADQKSNVAKLSSDRNTTLVGVCTEISNTFGLQIQMEDCVIFSEDSDQNKSHNDDSFVVNNENEASKLLGKALQEMGRLKDPLEDIESHGQSKEIIAGNSLACWTFSTTFQDNRNYPNGNPAIGYAVSTSGEIFQYYPDVREWGDLGPIEDDGTVSDETNTKGNTPTNNAHLLMIVDITGDNVNVRSAPNAQGKVLFQVSKEDFLAVNKKPIQDSSGQEWYEVIFRMGSEDNEFGRISTPAYITGKFIKKHPESETVIEEFGLGYYYTF
jgi:ankyrin repeat protein